MGRAHIWTPRGVGIDTDALTATPNDAVAGYTGLFKGSDELQEGTIANATQNHSLGVNETWAPPAGFHDGTGKVSQSIPNRGAWNGTVGVNGKTTIPAGYHNGKGTVSRKLTTIAGGTYTPTAAGHLIDTTNKVLTSAIVVPKDANLKSANIATKMWGVAPGFTPLDTAYTLYSNGNYYGWWKDGLVENFPESPSQYASYIYPNTLTWRDNPPTRKVKPSSLVIYYDDNTKGNFSWYCGYMGLKTIDLSLYKTASINFSMVGSGDAYRPAVSTRLWIYTTEKRREDDVQGNDHKLNGDNGADGTYTDVVDISKFSGHYYVGIMIRFHEQFHIAGGNANHGWSYRKVTINSIILGK